MGFIEKAAGQFRRPTGRTGRFVGRFMNIGHARLWHWGFSQIHFNPGATILDVGCGGGKTVQKLSQVSPGGKIYGIDYSMDMVQLAKKINKELIQKETVEIMHGQVSALQFSDGMFDYVTAFETYYFWPNLVEDLKEIKRVLKPDGTFLMVNESYKHEKFERRNSRLVKWGNLHIHSPEEYRAFLTEAGYSDIEIIELVKKNWITAIGKKK